MAFIGEKSKVMSSFYALFRLVKYENIAEHALVIFSRSLKNLKNMFYELLLSLFRTCKTQPLKKRYHEFSLRSF